MFPCGGYDPGYAAYLSALPQDDIEHAMEIAQPDRYLCAVTLAAVGLCYGLLYLVL
jgi:hypothetical protein